MTGCSSRLEPLGEVAGRVTYEGQPFSEAEIHFSNPDQGVFIKAPLGGDGSYEMKIAGRLGLPLGAYQVAIRKPTFDAVTGGPQPTPPPRTFPDIPPKYLEPETSGLSLTVKPGMNELNIDLQP
jgi:hypothetical protein